MLHTTGASPSLHYAIPPTDKRGVSHNEKLDWPLCYIPSFVEIDLLVPVKKIFEGFLPYMGMAAILVM